MAEIFPRHKLLVLSLPSRALYVTFTLLLWKIEEEIRKYRSHSTQESSS